MHDRNVIESVNAISLLSCHEFVRITIPQSSGYFGRNSTRERIISKERVDASVSQTPFSFRKKNMHRGGNENIDYRRRKKRNRVIDRAKFFSFEFLGNRNFRRKDEVRSPNEGERGST